jgi:hypothetical protein
MDDKTAQRPVTRGIRTIPTEDLTAATQICDPWLPLQPGEDDSIREDFDAARGGNRLVRMMQRIRRAGARPTLHFLTGHMGSGKTTELLRMREALRIVDGQHLPVEVLVVDADTLLDRRDVDVEDLLIALWGAVFAMSWDAAHEVLKRVWKEQIADHLKSAVVNLALPEQVAGAVNGLLKHIKLAAPERRRAIRTSLGDRARALVEGLNAAFEKVRDQQSTNIAILIDNLEKLSLSERSAVEHLYLERMGVLRDLDAHLVITVPLYLIFSQAGATLTGLYGGHTVLMPMVKVRNRASQANDPEPPGLELLANMLEKRVKFSTLFVSGRAAARKIAALSGGSIRYALRITAGAIDEHDAPPVTDASIDRSAAQIRAEFDRALPEAWVPCLRFVAAHNRFPDDCDPDIKRDALRHLFVLEYQNGDPDPWYGVHPLVEQLTKYKEHRGD